MIHLDGTNAPKGVKKVTINGSWITADGVQIRTPDRSDWYDESHMKVVNAVVDLVDALSGLTICLGKE